MEIEFLFFKRFDILNIRDGWIFPNVEEEEGGQFFSVRLLHYSNF